MKENRENRGGLARILAAAALLALTAPVFFPQLLELLPQGAARAIRQFLADNNLAAGHSFDLAPLAAILLVLAAAWAASALLTALLGLLRFKSRRANTLLGVLIQVVNALLFLTAAVLALRCVGLNTAEILASAGVLALVIGLGTQSVFADIFSGLFIIAEGQFAVGDIVSIDGFRGTVTAMGLRSVSVRDAGGNIRIVNNSAISGITNLSAEESVAVCSFQVPVGSCLADAEQAIEKAMAALYEKRPELFSAQPRYRGVEDITAYGMVLQITAPVAEEQVYEAQRAMLRDARIALEEAGVYGG